MDGIGLHDLADIAAFEHGQRDALTATVNSGVDAGGGRRIDRGLVNDAGRHMLVPGSFRVEIPDPPFPSDHRVIRFLLDL